MVCFTHFSAQCGYDMLMGFLIPFHFIRNDRLVFVVRLYQK